MTENIEPTENQQPEVIESKKTKLVSPQKGKTKLVQIKAIRALLINGKEILEDETVEVSEEQAEELCKPISGYYDFEGERTNRTAVKQQIVRAVRI